VIKGLNADGLVVEERTEIEPPSCADVVESTRSRVASIDSVPAVWVKAPLTDIEPTSVKDPVLEKDPVTEPIPIQAPAFVTLPNVRKSHRIKRAHVWAEREAAENPGVVVPFAAFWYEEALTWSNSATP
jgi:hypothetical protein